MFAEILWCGCSTCYWTTSNGQIIVGPVVMPGNGLWNVQVLRAENTRLRVQIAGLLEDKRCRICRNQTRCSDFCPDRGERKNFYPLREVGREMWGKKSWWSFYWNHERQQCLSNGTSFHPVTKVVKSSQLKHLGELHRSLKTWGASNRRVDVRYRRLKTRCHLICCPSVTSSCFISF